MRRISIIIIISIISILTMPVYAPRTPTTTTIPPITAQSAGVQLQCFPLQVFPGSVVPGSSGFIRVRCPDKNGAVQFGEIGIASTTVTPTFTLGIGYTNASIIFAGSTGNPCNFNFGILQVGHFNITTGSFLNHQITFGNPPASNSQLLATSYDYCLQYNNAPTTGLAGFDIVWT